MPAYLNLERHLAWMRLRNFRPATINARKLLLLRLARWNAGTPPSLASADELAEFQLLHSPRIPGRLIGGRPEPVPQARGRTGGAVSSAQSYRRGSRRGTKGPAGHPAGPFSCAELNRRRPASRFCRPRPPKTTRWHLIGLRGTRGGDQLGELAQGTLSHSGRPAAASLTLPRGTPT